MWFYISSGVRKGPVTDDAMRQLLDGKWVDRKTLVWTAGMAAWTPIRDTALATKNSQPPAGSSEPAEPPPLPAPVLRSLKPLWGWLRVLLVFYLLASLTYAVTLFHQIGVFEQIVAGAFESDEAMVAAANRSDALVTLASLFFLAMLAWCFFIWARLTYRAVRNLKEIRAEGVTFSPGWAVGFYFIPIAFFWKPLQAVRQIWRASTSPRSSDSVSVPAWIGVWWALFLLGNLLGQISFRLSLFGSDADLILAAKIDIASCVLDLLMVPLVFVLWSSITKKQEALVQSPPADPQRVEASPVEAVLRPIPL